MTLLSLPFKSRSPINLGLHSGAASGNLGLVKFALDNGQPIDSVLNGLLPIHVASAGGHVQVVKYLLERGADVNSRRRPRRNSGGLLSRNVDYNSTALHFAASNGNVELVILLLKWGAQISAVDKYGSTPFSIAAAKKHHTVAMLLQKPQRSLTSSSMPSLHNSKTSFKLLSPSTKSKDLTPIVPNLNLGEKLSPKLEHVSVTKSPSEALSMTPSSPTMPLFRRGLSERSPSTEAKHQPFRSLTRIVQRSSMIVLPSSQSTWVSLFSASAVSSAS